MAIDNAEKRKALSGIQVTLSPGVTPNASTDQEWRQQSGWGYSGILADAPSVVSTVAPFAHVGYMDPMTSVGFMDPFTHRGSM